MASYEMGLCSASIVFAIGKILKGHVQSSERAIFGRTSPKYDLRIGPANQAIELYDFQVKSCRKAVDAWSVVGMRNRIVKDIRVMIAKMIWNAREEAEY
jgi:hypothetical protein